ncbi:MAG: MarR family transcriptional regulator, partial [Spirochaetales bacterium]|nr:MarR family transcriptional regulator [Spirochaetales bacterium]
LPQLRLDNQVCFLVYSLEHKISRLYRELLRPLGVTYPQYLVLLVLWEEQRMGVAALAERLHLDTGTVSPLLKRMERAGLVTRRRSAADERSVEVSLTAKGRALEKRAAGIPAALLDRLAPPKGVDGERFVQDLRALLAPAGDRGA